VGQTIVKASKRSDAGVMPSEELLAGMASPTRTVKAGALLVGEGLQPTSKRLGYAGAARTGGMHPGQD